MNAPVNSRLKWTEKGAPCGDNSNNAFILTLPYFSKVLWTFDKVAGVYVLEKGTSVDAFCYGVSETRVGAGYSTADGVGTIADTNLAKGRETINGETLEIHGISISPLEQSVHTPDGGSQIVQPQDYTLLGLLMANVSVSMMLNTRGRLNLGIPRMVPGASGLYGHAARVTDYTGSAGDPVDRGFVSNGMPIKGNAFNMDDPIYWNDDGADSLISLNFELQRNISFAPSADVAGDVDPGNVANNQYDFDSPDTLISEWVIEFHGKVLGERSRTF